jgi:hypothetical protein
MVTDGNSIGLGVINKRSPWLLTMNLIAYKGVPVNGYSIGRINWGSLEPDILVDCRRIGKSTELGNKTSTSDHLATK